MLIRGSDRLRDALDESFQGDVKGELGGVLEALATAGDLTDSQLEWINRTAAPALDHLQMCRIGPRLAVGYETSLAAGLTESDRAALLLLHLADFYGGHRPHPVERCDTCSNYFTIPRLGGPRFGGRCPFCKRRGSRSAAVPTSNGAEE